MDICKHNLILGSASPRRKQLLEDAGFLCKTTPINAEESFPAHLQAQEIPLYLAHKKASNYPFPLKENDVLITADTVVWVKNTVLNKPENELEAKQMLQILSGKKHQVFTGVCLTSSKKQVSFYDETTVFFKTLTEQEIIFYIRKYQPFDKAGSYGAQDWMGLTSITRLEGSYFNVMGLPTHKLYEHLQQF
ncbi:MAG: septum formation protein Maf [Bacteroidetes bacterium]|nr:septum formation protein Maf [Bacteroidota bacterium]